MDSKYFGLNATIGKLVKSPADQGRIVGIAAGLAAASQGQLPSSPVVNISAFYAQMVFPMVQEKLSDVNESIIFAAKSALEYAGLFWQMRYYAAFPAQLVDTYMYRLKSTLESNVGKGMDVSMLWCGGQVLISDEMSAFMNRYKVEITLINAEMIQAITPDVQYTDSTGAICG